MLSGPMEILELNDGESLTVHVTAWTLDDAIIRPAHAPAGKAIKVLRLQVLQTDKKTFPYYYDVTAMGAIAQLQPWLEKPDFKDKSFTLTAAGSGPKKRYSLGVS